MSQVIHQVSVSDFIRTRGVGKIDLPLSIKNFKNLCEVWKKHPEQNILVDLRERTLEFTPKEVRCFLDIVIEGGMGFQNRVAFLYRLRPPFDHVKFFEFLAVGHGMKIKGFLDFEEALVWLGAHFQTATAQ